MNVPSRLRPFVALVLAVLLCITRATVANAGLMDKLKAATDKLNAKTQQQGSSNQPQVAEDEDHPMNLEDHFHGTSCEGKRSATCMDYTEVVDKCMAPLNGYRMKLWGDRIDKRLKTEQLTDAQRKTFQEDLTGFREAENNKSENPTIAGEKNSQRYLSDASEEDQVYVNAEYDKFYKKIYNKCIGADHMGVGHRTEMMTDHETMSGDEAVAALKKKNAEDRAPFDCLKNAGNVRWEVQAEWMEKKMAKANPTGKEKADWEADIAAIRDVPNTGGMPKSSDPANPMRPMMRLTPEEQNAMMQEFITRQQEEMNKCQGVSGSSTPKAAALKKGLVDHTQSPANPNAKPTPEKKNRGARTTYADDGSLSAHLGATKVDAMIEYANCSNYMKGGFAAVHADTLQAKLDKAGTIPAQKRKEWEEDIAAWNAAAAAGKQDPVPPDPNNPYRWYDYLTNQERAQINQKYAQMVNDMNAKCNQADPLGVKKNNLQTRYGADVGKPKPKPKPSK